MVFLFPIVYYYLSPYLIIAGGSEGIIAGSFISFIGMFIGSLFLFRLQTPQPLCFSIYSAHCTRIESYAYYPNKILQLTLANSNMGMFLRLFVTNAVDSKRKCGENRNE